MESFRSLVSPFPNEPWPAVFGESWLTFLHNHREVTVAFDFFTVPTMTYYIFVLEHERRKILHSNVTRHPTTA